MAGWHTPEIELLPAGRVVAADDALVYRHSTGRAAVGASVALTAGVGLLSAGVVRGSALASYGGVVCLITLFLFRRQLSARLRQSNWLVQLDGRGVCIHFRSYLNHRLPSADHTVVCLPFSVIRLARTRTERKETSYRDADDHWVTRTSVETLTWVEFEVRANTEALARALDTELARRPPSGALYKDYPVRVVTDGVIQVRWTVTPGADEFLAALREHVPVGEPAACDTHFAALQSLPIAEQHRRLAELVRAGDTVTAVTLARALRGGDLASAKAFVDHLVALPEAAAPPDVGHADPMPQGHPGSAFPTSGERTHSGRRQ